MLNNFLRYFFIMPFICIPFSTLYAERNMAREIKRDTQSFRKNEVSNIIVTNKHGDVYLKNTKNNLIVVELIYYTDDLNNIEFPKDLNVLMKREKSVNDLDLRIEDKIKSKLDKVIKLDIVISAPSSLSISTHVKNGKIFGDSVSFRDIAFFISNSKIRLTNLLLQPKARCDINATDYSEVIIEIDKNSSPFRLSVDREDIKSASIEFPFTTQTLSINKNYVYYYRASGENNENGLSRIDLENSTLVVK